MMQNNTAASQYNKDHYNSVTDAWLYILGDNLHYGYFKSPDTALKDATICLIDKLAEMDDISRDSLVLDVGCGIGSPAFYLHEKYGCQITGISTSERGLNIARKVYEAKKIKTEVTFQLADALDNHFSDNYFDFVWQMESSHLIKDKKKLFNENFRVLKNNGIMLLCDLILIKEFTVADLYKYREELTDLEKSFGKAKMESLGTYNQMLKEAGFSNIQVIDVSKWVWPTLDHWQKNVTQNKKKILEHLNTDELKTFIRSCKILNLFFKNSILGYGLIKAQKVEKTKNE